MSRFDRIILTFLLSLSAFWVCREADYLQRCQARQPDILVSVSGAVREPGVVRLPAGARAVHAIMKCGGFSPEARSESVPLARLLEDGENLLVPKTERDAPPLSSLPSLDTPSPPLPVEAPEELEAAAPRPETVVPETEPPSADSPSRSPAQAGRAPATPSEPLDLNCATLEELDALPGVGPVTARRILQARQASPGGTFGSLEELRAIRGIKGKTFQRLKPYLKIEGS